MQPAELLALPLLAYAALRVLRDRPRLVWTSVDVGVLAWLGGVVTAGAVFLVRTGAWDAAVARDVATTLYLGLLYFAIRVVADHALVGTAAEALVAGASLAAAMGVLGFALSQVGTQTPLAFSADSAYPYLGSAARARALTATPNMLASILMLALLLLAAGAASRLNANLRRAAAGLLALGFALTFSKTIVPLAAGLVMVWALHRRRQHSRPARFGVGLSWLAAALAFTVFSHVVVLCGDVGPERFERAMFISDEPLVAGELIGRRCATYATSYFFLKRASLIAMEQSWPWGIGPSRHSAFVGRLQRDGRYPETLWRFVPHSSYTGAAAELGLAGVLGLAAFLGGLALGIRDALRRDSTRPLAVAAAAALAALLIEAIATDVMHFRHYTWLAALVGATAARVRD